MKDDRNKGKPQEDINAILEKAKAEWEAAFDSISEGIAMVEPDGRIRRVNRALAALLGREVRSMAGMCCCDVFPHHKAYDEACPVRFFPEGKKGAFEVFFPDYRYYEDSINPVVRGGKNQGYVIAVRDVTREQLSNQERRHVYLQMEEAARKRKMVEEALGNARTELARVEKLATLGNLAGMIFSEVARSARTIEEGLAILAERCSAGGKSIGSEEMLPIVAGLSGTAARSRHILDKLTRLRVDQPQAVAEVNISRLVDEAVREAAPAASSSQVTLRPNLLDIPPVHGNSEQLSAVLSSIILNAIEATRDSHGEVTISIRREGDFARVDVEDTGKGIQAEYLPQIFNPFFTTHGSTTSAGLGLTICLAIVQSHHGHIEVQSAPGRGTTVKVLLPLAA